ncbi:MAG: GNAT family protein [Candidatus Latescibacterota bacterium]
MNPLLLDIPTEFISARLVLRRYCTADAPTYFQTLRANHEHLYEFLPPYLLAVQTEEDAALDIRRLEAEWDLRNLFRFGVWERETGGYVGGSYLANPDWEVPRIEVGYFVVKASTGKGIGTEAARATVRFAFEHLQAVRVELQCAADNPASMRVAEHCGFVREDRLRQRHRTKAGTLVDMLWYGLLLSDWQPLVAS